MRIRPRTGTMGANTARTMTLPRMDSPATRQADLHNLWDRTAEEPWPSTAAQQPLAEQPLAQQPLPEDTEEHARLDDRALREMEDIRTGATSAWPSADSDSRGGGIELRYGDDDL